MGLPINRRKRTVEVKVQATDLISVATNLPREDAEKYKILAARYHRRYSEFFYTIKQLFEENNEQSYRSRLTDVSDALDTFGREAREFGNHPLTKKVSSSITPSTAFLSMPYIGRLLNRLREEDTEARMKKLVEERFFSAYGYRAQSNHDFSDIMNKLRLAKFVGLHSGLPSRLRRILTHLERIEENGGSEAAISFLTAFTRVLPRKTPTGTDYLPAYFIDQLSRTNDIALAALFQIYERFGFVDRYASLGKMGAVTLNTALQQESSRFARYRMQNSLNFIRPVLLVDELKDLSDDINIATLSTLVRTSPIGKRNYIFKTLLKNPSYVSGFENLSPAIAPEVYTAFLMGYGDIPITINGRETSVFDIVNETASKNKSGAAWLVRNPSIWTSPDLSAKVKELQTIKEKPEVTYTKRRRERVGWFDVIFSADHPLRPLVRTVYQRLSPLGGEHRLKQVPQEKLKQFCDQVQEIPKPLLVHLVRDPELFEAYLERLDDGALFERFERIALEGGNLYRELYDELKPPSSKNPMLSALNHVFGMVDEQLPEPGNNRYGQIVVWGDLKEVQKREIQVAVDSTKLIFVNPLTEAKRLPDTDAVLFVTGRGVSHGQYYSAKGHYKRLLGTDVYHISRQVGSSSIIRYIRNIQQSAQRAA